MKKSYGFYQSVKPCIALTLNKVQRNGKIIYNFFIAHERRVQVIVVGLKSAFFCKSSSAYQQTLSLAFFCLASPRIPLALCHVLCMLPARSACREKHRSRLGVSSCRVCQ